MADFPAPPSEPRRHRVVLDTDLGSDPDDAMALAVLLGSDEVDLLGAVTVYGDVEFRARLLTGYAGMAGRPVTVATGAGEPLSGRPVWMSGEEGALFPGAPGPDPATTVTDGVGWLLDRARESAGDLEVLAIGPLTDLATALRAEPSFGSGVRRVWMMGGLFASARSGSNPDTDDPEHNFSSDALASAEVLASGLPITVLGLELTRRLRLGEPELAEFLRMGELGAQLEKETRAWMRYWDEPFDVPHDAIAAVAMLRPELFEVRTAHVRVLPDGPRAGQVVEDGAGAPVDVVTDLDEPAVRHEILTRIRVAATT